MQSIVLLSVSLFAVLGARAQNATCPKPVVCVANPCDGARCPRFPVNTECKVDACHGECRATFFRLSDRREVTNRCAGPTCAQKSCPAGWTCMNTLFPTACSRNRPNCRRYIKPQCVRPQQPQPPTDCSQVLCPPDRSFCEVRQTPRGPRARCIPQPPPTSCDNVECEKGMQCQVRERKAEAPVARCVPDPIRVVEVPRDCSQLECSDGFMCVVMDSKAMCVETPSPPDECGQLACEEQQECRIITFSDVPKAVCGPVSDCSKMSCNESEGLECRVAGEGQKSVAFCTPTTNLMPYNESVNCSRISCNRSEGLECRIVGEGVSAVAVCLVTRNCTVLNPICRRDGLVCQEPQSQDEFALASCVAPPSCEKLECNPGFICIDFDGENGGDISSGSGFLPPDLQSTHTPSDLVTAVCIANSTQASCEAFPCKEGQMCRLQRYPSRSISLVTCRTFPQGVLPHTPSSPVSCDNVKCTSTDWECLQSEEDGEIILTACVPSGIVNNHLQPILSQLPKGNQPSTNS